MALGKQNVKNVRAACLKEKLEVKLFYFYVYVVSAYSLYSLLYRPISIKKLYTEIEIKSVR